MTSLRALFDFYWATTKVSIQTQFQYPLANYFYMIGMITEPVIYLVVWSTVANAQGGSVGGYTAGEFAAYFIVWTLVRNMNIVFTPFGWEWRIRQGRLSTELMRPIHPLHNDIAYFIGWKVVVILLWLPLAAFLIWVFKATFDPTPLEVVVFFFAIWGAYLIRTMFSTLIGLVTFWTTRVSAIFELYFAVELLLSGRLVPLSLMPDWVRALANFFPFQWAFGFPIESLVGQMTPEQLLGGLGMQLFWIVLGALIVNVVWRYAIRQYAAVGN
jgi:ABC-2 type transport system permease protein